MSEARTEYGILVAVDGSAESDAAVRWAAIESGLRHAPVTLMYVITPVTVSWPAASLQSAFDESQEENARAVLAKALETLRANVGESVQTDVHTKVVHSHVLAGLVEQSRAADLIVVGCRGLGAVGRTVLGSVSSGLAYRAHCPVVIVRADDAQAPDHTSPVLLGVDGSPASEEATAFAFDEASRRGVELVVLHAWSDFLVYAGLAAEWQEFEEEASEVLAERLAGWQEKYPDVTVVRRVVCDQPAHWLIEESQHAQLVVVGSHGRGGFQGMLLGSVSRAVAHGSKAPVIIIRPK